MPKEALRKVKKNFEKVIENTFEKIKDNSKHKDN